MNISDLVERIEKMDAAKRQIFRENALRNIDDPKLGANAKLNISTLDEVEQREKQQKFEKLQNMTRTERVTAAFKELPLKEGEQKVMQVLLDNPGHSSAGLSSLLGWDGQIWHLKFGELCKDREHLLWPAEPAFVREGDFYCGILADLDSDNLWQVKPEVEEGLAKLGIRAKRKPAK